MCLWLPAYSRTALPSKPILSPKWYLCYINGASIHVTVVCIRSGHLIWANKSEPSPWFRNSEQWVSDMKGCVDSGLRALSEPWWVIREIFLWERSRKVRQIWGGGEQLYHPWKMESPGKMTWRSEISLCWALCAWIPESSRFLHYHPPMLHPFLEELTQSSPLLSTHIEKLWLKHCTSAGSGLHQGPTNAFARILRNSENLLSPHIF